MTFSDMVGTWRTTYAEHTFDPVDLDALQEKLNGIETVVFLPDGTYTHSFSNKGYHYESPPANWRIQRSTLDSPRVKMNAMRYFAVGVTGVGEELRLGPEKPEILEYQDARQNPDFVQYPADGFVYLYLGRCSGKLVLQQMIYGGISDPDNMSIVNPMFYRQ